MENNKYIIVDNLGIESAIVFSSLIEHCTIASSYPKSKIVAAGFCDFYFNGGDKVCVSAYGKSTTLNVSSRGKQDASIIFRTLFRNM